MNESARKPARAGRSLGRYYNASQLRADTWNRLKHYAARLEQSKAGKREVEHMTFAMDEFLEILEPIETYWAFPGPEAFAHLRRLFEEGGTPRVLDTVFDGMDREVVERMPLLHRCRCDGDRLRAHLAMLPEEDLDGLRTDDGEIEGLCVFCGTRYAFAPAGL
jgi:hypothetical protein